MNTYRSHNCGELSKSDVGQTVRLSGWVHRKRDHGGLLFIDLRDNYGLTQLVFDPDRAEAFALAEKVRSEWVVRIDGKVVARAGETVNPNLATGAVEVQVSAMEVLSEAQELPLPVFGEPDYPEETRLTYRFLDLRRETLHNNILLRSKIIASARRRMTEAGFNEFQTPILTASSPEGARDFLVPRAFIRASSTPCRRRRSSSSSSSWLRASTAIFRSRPASVTRTPVPTAAPANSISSTSR